MHGISVCLLERASCTRPASSPIAPSALNGLGRSGGWDGHSGNIWAPAAKMLNKWHPGPILAISGTRPPKSVDLGRSVRTLFRGEVSSPLPPSAGPLFCTSSRGSFEMVEPNRFSGLADPKPRTPRVSFQGSTWATLFEIVKHLWLRQLGFLVLWFPVVFSR